MLKCEKCAGDHTGEYGSGRFCSRSCAKSFCGLLQEKKIKKVYDYTCEKCGAAFTRAKLKRGCRPHCDECKRAVPHVHPDPKTLLELSKRTVSKILKRARVECSMCGWNKTSLDIHHIEQKSKGGTDEHRNLIALCPNCHRMAHEKLYTAKELSGKSLAHTFESWLDYYRPSN